MIKAVVVDLDGTIISHTTGTYSEATKAAFEKLHQAGIYIFAATGRAKRELENERLVEGLYFDALILLNGQHCYSKDRLISKQLFDKGDLRKILQRVSKNPHSCAIVEENDLYVNLVDERLAMAQKAIHTALPPAKDIQGALDREVLMVMAYVSEAVAQELLQGLENSVITRWHPYGVDIVPKGCGKRTGLEKVLEEYGLTWDQVIAFGDGENDYEMLKCAKCGVAMGNADQKLLSGEFPITETVDNDGVVQMLRQQGLI